MEERVRELEERLSATESENQSLASQLSQVCALVLHLHIELLVCILDLLCASVFF